MKIAITREAYRTGLSAVNSIVPSRSTLPVLQNTLMETVGDNQLRFSGSDLDVTVRVLVPAQVHQAGALSLPAKKQAEIARELPDADIDIEAKDNTASIKGGRSRFKLNGLPKDEFPSASDMDWSNASSVTGAVLKEMISHVIFAVSTEETRPILNGVLWEIRDGEMRMVATNGHRLSKIVAHTNGSTPAPAGKQFIIHPKALARVESLFSPDDTVEVVFEDNHIGFRTETVEVIARLIEGPYPNYEQVIPKDNDKKLVVEKKGFQAAVRRMSIVASDQTHRIRLALGGPMLKFSVQTPDLGEASEELPVEYAGEALEIGFNANYLLELLRYMPGDQFEMAFKAPERAATLRPVAEGNEIPDVEMLVMPLRLLD